MNSVCLSNLVSSFAKITNFLNKRYVLWVKPIWTSVKHLMCFYMRISQFTWSNRNCHKQTGRWGKDLAKGRLTNGCAERSVKLKKVTNVFLQN